AAGQRSGRARRRAGRLMGLSEGARAAVALAVRTAAVTVFYRGPVTAESRPRALAHHARDAARPLARQLDLALEVAARGIGAVAGPPVGPGAAAGVGLAGLRAGRALWIGL